MLRTARIRPVGALQLASCFMLFVLLAAGRVATAQCPTPPDSSVAAAGLFTLGFTPPPEGEDIRMDATFLPPDKRQPRGIKKQILIRQDADSAEFRRPWVVARASSDNGLAQVMWIQSDGTHPVTMEFRECATTYWGAQQVTNSGASWGGDSTQYTVAEPGNEARFTLTWGPSIHRPALPERPVPTDDVANALTHVRWAWGDQGPCSRFWLCATYFDSWGVNLNFNDGTGAPFAHVQRLTTSGHDCIVYAKRALSLGDRALAVEWVMASQIHNTPVKDWLKNHPDAVVSALRQVG